MKVAWQILQELYQLFVEDGRLAMLLLLWSGIVWGIVSFLPAMAGIGGIALVFGCVAILLENIWRFGLQKRRDVETSDGRN